MNSIQAELFARIRDFDIDDGKPDFTFVARLARENCWSLHFAHRAIVEYKHFLFLALTAGHPITPSVQVDEVWHLHLTFTRSYWQRLCGELLGRPLHHDPTRGGSAESSKFHSQYEQTLALYRQAFGQEPPAEMWPATGQRFAEDDAKARTHWGIPKNLVKRGLFATIALSVIALVSGCGLISGFTISPENALRCFPFVWLSSLLVGYFARERMRSPGIPPADNGVELGWVEAAYLVAPGRKSNGTRLLSAALARLVALEAARVSLNGEELEATGARPGKLSRVQRQILDYLPLRKADRDRMGSLVRDLEYACDDTARHLFDEGYLLSDAKRIGIGPATVVTVFVSFAILYLPILACVEDKHFVLGMLCLCLPAVSLPSFLLGFATMSRWTHSGRQARKRLRRAVWRGYLATNDPSLAVAAFGTTVLAGTAYAALKSWYPQTSSGSTSGCGVGCGGGAGCSGGGCGGGCGGGGCGGG